VTEALLVGAGVLVILALAGFAIWQSRKAGAAEADRSSLDNAINKTEKANAARAAVDASADPLAELRRDYTRR
jgi:predicted negative regulator of RcsB-dependent stress response